MRVLMISGDPHILEQRTPAHERLELQRAQVERLDVFVWPQLHSFFTIIRAVLTNHYDVITAQDPFWRGHFAWHLSWMPHTRLNIQVHTDLSAEPWLKRHWGYFQLRRADSIRVVSEKIKEQVEQLGVRARIDILPIFVELDTFRTVQKKPHVQKTILWIGRFESEKDPYAAISIFKQVRASGVEVKMVMLGVGSQSAGLHEAARGLPIEFPGWQASVLPYMEVADAVLSTSLYESWGASIVEALAAGLPVVAPDVGVAREAGAIVVPHAELASAVVQVLQKGTTGELKLQLLNKEEWAKVWREALI